MDLGKILETLVTGNLSGGRRGRRRRRRRGRGGLGGGVRRAAFSPGGLSLLAGVAIAAYEHFSKKNGGDTLPGAQALPEVSSMKPPTKPAPPNLPPVPNLPPLPNAAGAEVVAEATADPSAAAAADGSGRAHTLVLAMLNAAKADGVVDEMERERIVAQLDATELGEEERAFVLAEMEKPFDLEGLVARVDEPTLAAEVYVASLIVIDEEVPVETAYLEQLAARLRLPEELATELRSKIAEQFADDQSEDEDASEEA